MANRGITRFCLLIVVILSSLTTIFVEGNPPSRKSKVVSQSTGGLSTVKTPVQLGGTLQVSHRQSQAAANSQYQNANLNPVQTRLPSPLAINSQSQGQQTRLPPPLAINSQSQSQSLNAAQTRLPTPSAINSQSQSQNLNAAQTRLPPPSAINSQNPNGNNANNLPSVPTSSSTARTRNPKACKILINEIYTAEDLRNAEQFIEFRRVCPKGVPTPSFLTLSGTYVFFIKLTEQPKIVLAADLAEQRLKRIQKIKTTGTEDVFLFGLGTTTNNNFDLRFGPSSKLKPKLLYNGYPRARDILPLETNDLILVGVVYVPAEKRADFWKNFNFPKGTQANSHILQELPLTTLLKQQFVFEFHDFIVYGTTPNEMAQNLVRELTKDENFNIAKSMLSLKPTFAIMKEQISYSRCDDNPRSSQGFKFEPPTPMEPNTCQDESETQKLFTFQGVWFPPVAQQLIVNVVYSIMKARDNVAAFFGNPPQVASRLLGLSLETVEKYLTRATSCGLLSPTAQKKKPVIDKIDSFDRKYIQNLIAKSYKAGKPPFANQIHKEFLDYKNGESTSSANQDVSLEAEDEVSTSEIMEGCFNMELADEVTESPSAPQASGKKFKCSYKTFRLLLKDMGFSYGKIDGRVAIMNRWDLALWRTKFVRALRENENLANPMPVTYLDETWVDPFAKWDRGWRIKHPSSTQEALRYSYSNMKIGSGPRLIVFAAADDHGIIKESIKVRKISKDSAKADYHGNVDRKEFKDWLKNLLDYFDRKKEKHIIVLDNASYHSTMAAPTSKANKPELITWLEMLKQNPQFSAKVPNIAGLLKWELWDIVQRLKNDPEVQPVLYEIDKMALDRGHRVLRNAPYHCSLNPIEMVWSQVKAYVKKQNVQQNVDTTLALVEKALNDYNPKIWANQLKHVKNLRDKAWREDQHLDNTIAELVIPLDDEDDDDDDDVDDSDGEPEDSETNENAECIANDEWDSEYLDFQEQHKLENQKAREWVASLGPAPKYNQRQPKRRRFCNDGFY